MRVRKIKELFWFCHLPPPPILFSLLASWLTQLSVPILLLNTVLCSLCYNVNDCCIVLGCNCDRVGSISPDTCDSTTGQCNCRQMYTSRQCTQCSKGFYSFPECNGTYMYLLVCEFPHFKFLSFVRPNANLNSSNTAPKVNSFRHPLVCNMHYLKMLTMVNSKEHLQCLIVTCDWSVCPVVCNTVHIIWWCVEFTSCIDLFHMVSFSHITPSPPPPPPHHLCSLN